MKPTGLIKRVDNLGRIVIPRELRKQAFETTDTDDIQVEFFLGEDDSIILKRVQLVEVQN